MGIEALQHHLADMGLTNLGPIHWNPSTPELYEQAIERHEAHLSHLGPLVTRTGAFTGRAPNDKFVVDEPGSRDDIWWGKVNRPMSEEHFDGLFKRACGFLEGRSLFVQDVLLGADPNYELPVRIITQKAWHSLFARNMFIRPANFDREIGVDEPGFTVLQVPEMQASPGNDGTHSDTFIVVNMKRRLVLIGGTHYAGEIKKSMFSVMNYLLPKRGILTMHSSANVDDNGSVAVFFGLSGTGKTTLSADPSRKLIGDDEHAWSDDGVFNLEGGCYAKVIRLDPEREPLIHDTTRRFGTVLENVAMDYRDRRLDLDDDSYTENTRAAYPITHIPNALYPGVAGHPDHIIMLTADAFGVLPPVARLTPEQAMYHFISGYTAKVAGTEKGVTEPTATFSACFGAPFMPLHPARYAKLLGEKIQRHGTECWMVNTGWTGGPYGTGSRIDIKHTRAMLDAVLSGELADAPMRVDPVFGFEVPTRCPGVPDAVLDPASTWADKQAYAAKVEELARAFVENFTQYADGVDAHIAAAAPSMESQVA
ncbi:MAG: phosphoenolpyruvate carboxykinase (ATP) [Gammaproteobacteria bacterium]